MVSHQNAIILETEEEAALGAAVIVSELIFDALSLLIVFGNVSPCLQREEDGKSDDESVDNEEKHTSSTREIANEYRTHG